MEIAIENPDDAYDFLAESGAPPELILHVKLVGEAAEILIDTLSALEMPFDAGFVRLGVAFHDAGKIIHTDELSEKGNLHESAGEKLLLENGVAKNIARCCRSHGNWKTMSCSFEEHLVALSDKLWKGKREHELENLVIEKVSEMLNRDRWEIFVKLDSCFEKIASEGDSRLLKSKITKFMKLNAELNGEKHEIELTRDGNAVFARVDDREYELEASEVERDVYLLKYNNRIFEIYVAPSGIVNLGNHQLEISITDPKRLRGAGAGAASADGIAEIKTAMPGKLVRVLVAEGAEIKQGEGVLVVEAMKMQNEMKSPKDGIVKEIRFAEGATVNAGDILAVIE